MLSKTVVLEKTLESPLDCKEVQPVHPKGDQSWVFIGRTDAKTETLILWPPHAKNWLIGKDPDAERDWGQEEKGTTEDEMAGLHHWLDGHESEWTPGVGENREAWCAAIHGVAKSRTRLSDWTELWWSTPVHQYSVLKFNVDHSSPRLVEPYLQAYEIIKSSPKREQYYKTLGFSVWDIQDKIPLLPLTSWMVVGGFNY